MASLPAAPVRGEAPARAEFRTVPASLAPLVRAALAYHRRTTSALDRIPPSDPSRPAAQAAARSSEAILSRVVQSAFDLDPMELAYTPLAIACDDCLVIVPDCEASEYERAYIIEQPNVSTFSPRPRRVAAMRPARG